MERRSLEQGRRMFDIKKRSIGRRSGVPSVYRCRHMKLGILGVREEKIKWAGYVSEDVVVDGESWLLVYITIVNIDWFLSIS